MSETLEPRYASRNDAGSVGAVRRRVRDHSIDTLRGLAIILMVAGHVVGGDSTEGLQVADDSAWRTGYLLLADLRIPLFTALSGFVYGVRPLTHASQIAQFFRGKTKRLMLPLVTVGTIFAVLQALVPDTNAEATLSSWWMVYFYGLWHFWFLQAIFILLIGVGVANVFGLFTTSRSVLLTMGIAIVLAVGVRIPFPYDVFSVNGAIRLAPFFILGYGIARLWHHIDSIRSILCVTTGVLFIVRAWQILTHTHLPSPIDRTLGLTLGLLGITTLIAFRAELSWRPLAWLGYFSFSIYLLHVFGTAPTRMMLERVGVHSEVVLFVSCLGVGLMMPVVFEMTLGRVKLISWSVLGQKPYRPLPHSRMRSVQ